MKTVTVLLLLMVSLAISATLDYQSPFKVNANGSPITLSLGHANPLITDWNGDGLKDLIVGQFSGAKLRYYENSGTNAAPVFTEFTYMQSDGSDISLSSG